MIRINNKMHKVASQVAKLPHRKRGSLLRLHFYACRLGEVAAVGAGGTKKRRPEAPQIGKQKKKRRT
jgi:hypothetical protein